MERKTKTVKTLKYVVICLFILLSIISVMLIGTIKINLPLNVKTPSLMLIAFLLGLTVDFFSNTIGLHTAACTALGFVRAGYLKLLFSNLEFKFQQPSTSQFETGGYLKYAVGMVSLHHIILFMMEALSFNNFGFLLLRIIINIALTLVLIMCYELCRNK